MMIFSGLSGNSFTLSAKSSVASDATNRSAIQGFKILPTSLVPEPASASVLVLAASLLLGRRRQARRLISTFLARVFTAATLGRGGCFFSGA